MHKINVPVKVTKPDELRFRINAEKEENKIKIYAKNEKELKKMSRTVQTFSSDVNMKFGLEKCARVTNVRGKLKRKERAEDFEEEFIKELVPGSTY